MKSDIHPKWYPQAHVTCQCGNTWITGATVPEIRTEICSACHPFFTGEQRIVDTEGRVDKFLKRLQRRDAFRDQNEPDRSSLPANMSVVELGLNARFEKVLVENNITVVGDIIRLFEERGDEGVLGLSGIGQQALIDIKKGLRAQGFAIPTA